jgi:hypothetical protein
MLAAYLLCRVFHVMLAHFLDPSCQESNEELGLNLRLEHYSIRLPSSLEIFSVLNRICSLIILPS